MKRWARAAVVSALLLPACASTPPSPLRTAAEEGKSTGPLVPCKITGLASPLWDATDPSIGPADAPVVMMVFSDFECPYCGRFTGTILRVIDTFGDNVRVVFKHYPLSFHHRAKPTAEAAATVFAQGGDLAFFRFHDAAFEHQDDLTRESYIAFAKAAGLPDMAAFERALDAREGKQKVRADIDLGAHLGVSGTPHTFVNGRPISGARPFEEVAAIIQTELSQAKTRGPEVACARTQKHVIVRAPDADALPPRWKVELGASPQKGPSDAKVTIALFSDFQCTHCKEAEAPLAAIAKKYGADVRIVWKDFPLAFHPMSRKASWIAREAQARGGSAAFFQAHERIFAISPSFDDEALVTLAKTLDIPEVRAREVLAKKIHEDGVQADVDLGDDLDVAGTPTMFINGRKLVGARQLDELTEIIDDELDTVAAMLSRGVARDRVYAELQSTAKAPTLPTKKPMPVPPRDAPFRGDAKAPIVVEVFSDFQCKFCRRQNPALEELLAEYPKQVRVVWRNRPLDHHEDAMLAAEAAREVLLQKGNAAFWKFHDALFGSQKEKDGLKRAKLVEHARELGVDVAKLEKALDDHTHRAAITEESEAAEKAGVTATPTMSVAGYVARGTQTVGQLRRLVKLALAEVASAEKPSQSKKP